VAEYEVPTVPLGNVAVVSCKGAGLLDTAVLVEVELGELGVEAAVEVGLPLLFAFPPQARVTAVRHTSTTVLNNIFFIGVL
jgi:hypothetical protein